MIEAYAVVAVAMAGIGGFFLGTTFPPHPLNESMKATGHVLGVLALLVSLLALLAVARGH